MKKNEVKKDENKKKANKIKEYENNILSSPKNINLFNKMIESFIDYLDNKNEKKIDEIII